MKSLNLNQLSKSEFFHYLLIATFLLSLSFCSESKKGTITEIIKIDVLESIKHKPVHSNLSGIVDSCAYIFLETNEECLIDRINNLFLTKQYVIIIGKKDCLVFDRNTGKFIKKIGHYGEGPGEYLGIRHSFIDEKNEILYILSQNNQLLSYSINDANLINVIHRFNKYGFFSLDLIDSIHYIGNVMNLGEAKDRFISGTVYGDSVCSFPNHLFYRMKTAYDYENKTTTSFFTTLNVQTQFFHFKDKLYLKELLNDTLFHVKDSYTMIPQIIFETGKHRFPPEIRNDAEKITKEISNYIISAQIFETDDFLFALISYQSKYYRIAYNKKTGVNSLIDVTDEKDPFGGFPNDIVIGLPPFWTEFENNSGEMVAWYFPGDLKEFFKKSKRDGVSDELKNKIEFLNEDDNPIVVIVK